MLLFHTLITAFSAPRGPQVLVSMFYLYMQTDTMLLGP
jgi:hypothetical protein